MNMSEITGKTIKNKPPNTHPNLRKRKIASIEAYIVVYAGGQQDNRMRTRNLRATA